MDKIVRADRLAKVAQTIMNMSTTTLNDVPMDKVIAEVTASRQTAEE